MNTNINAHDRSIIGAICQYPDMSISEKRKAIRKLNDPNLKPIIRVLTGLENSDILSKDDRIVLADIQKWKENRTKRLRNQEIQARRNNNEPTRLAKNLIRLKEQGIITDNTLLLYGVSGDLPEQRTYQQLNLEESRSFWERKFRNRYGDSWRNYFDTLPSIFDESHKAELSKEWPKEGF